MNTALVQDNKSIHLQGRNTNLQNLCMEQNWAGFWNINRKFAFIKYPV